MTNIFGVPIAKADEGDDSGDQTSAPEVPAAESVTEASASVEQSAPEAPIFEAPSESSAPAEIVSAPAESAVPATELEVAEVPSAPETATLEVSSAPETSNPEVSVSEASSSPEVSTTPEETPTPEVTQSPVTPETPAPEENQTPETSAPSEAENSAPSAAVEEETPAVPTAPISTQAVPNVPATDDLPEQSRTPGQSDIPATPPAAADENQTPTAQITESHKEGDTVELPNGKTLVWHNEWWEPTPPANIPQDSTWNSKGYFMDSSGKGYDMDTGAVLSASQRSMLDMGGNAWQASIHPSDNRHSESEAAETSYVQGVQQAFENNRLKPQVTSTINYNGTDVNLFDLVASTPPATGDIISDSTGTYTFNGNNWTNQDGNSFNYLPAVGQMIAAPEPIASPIPSTLDLPPLPDATFTIPNGPTLTLQSNGQWQDSEGKNYILAKNSDGTGQFVALNNAPTIVAPISSVLPPSTSPVEGMTHTDIDGNKFTFSDGSWVDEKGYAYTDQNGQLVANDGQTMVVSNPITGIATQMIVHNGGLVPNEAEGNTKTELQADGTTRSFQYKEGQGWVDLTTPDGAPLTWNDNGVGTDETGNRWVNVNGVLINADEYHQVNDLNPNDPGSSGKIKKYFVDSNGNRVTDLLTIVQIAQAIDTVNVNDFLNLPENQLLKQQLSDNQLHPNLLASGNYTVPNFVGSEWAVNSFVNSLAAQIQQSNVVINSASFEGVAIPNQALQLWADSVNQNGVKSGGQAAFDFLTKPIPVTDASGNPTGQFTQLAYVHYNETGTVFVTLNDSLIPFPASAENSTGQGSIIIGTLNVLVHENIHGTDIINPAAANANFNQLGPNVQAFQIANLYNLGYDLNAQLNAATSISSGNQAPAIGNSNTGLTNQSSSAVATQTTEINAFAGMPKNLALNTALRNASSEQVAQAIQAATGLKGTIRTSDEGDTQIVLPPVLGSDEWGIITIPKAGGNVTFDTEEQNLTLVANNNGYYFTVITNPDGTDYIQTVNVDNNNYNPDFAMITVPIPGVGPVTINGFSGNGMFNAATDSAGNAVDVSKYNLEDLLGGSNPVTVDILSNNSTNVSPSPRVATP